MVRHRILRTESAVTMYDTQGGEVVFDRVSFGPSKVMHIAHLVDRMESRVIPLAPLYEKFGYNSVIKASMNAGSMTAMIRVIDGGSYAVDKIGGILVTYEEYKRMLMEKSKYYDMGIGVSYTDPTTLVVVPLVRNWGGLTTYSKLYRGLFAALVVALIVYSCVNRIYESDRTPFQEMVMMAIILFKDSLLQLLYLA